MKRLEHYKAYYTWANDKATLVFSIWGDSLEKVKALAIYKTPKDMILLGVIRLDKSEAATFDLLKRG